MTIQSSTARLSFPCNGVSTVFPVNIQAYNASDFLVLATNAAGSIVLTLNSDYTLAASGSLTPPFWSLTTQTGQLVSPFAAGFTLQVILNPVQTQLSQYTQGQAFPSLAVQTNLDRQTQMVIRHSDILSRAVVAPDGDVNPVMLLPAAVLRKNTYQGYDGSGNLSLFNLLTAGTVLSTATLAPFLNLSQTPAEILAAVTPVNLAYLPGDPRRYGALGDGVTDDTVALTNCYKVGGRISYPGAAFTFLISAMIPVPITSKTYGAQSMVKFAAVFNDAGTNILCAFQVAGGVNDVSFQDLIFDGSLNTGKSLNNEFIAWVATALRGRVSQCRFQNLANPGSNLNCAVSFIGASDEGEVDTCSFDNCPGAVFSQGSRCRIINNIARAPKDVSFVLNGPSCVGGSIIGCKVFNSGTVSVAGAIAAEESPSDWIIAENYVFGVHGGYGIGAVTVVTNTLVTGGLIKNNVIDGGSGTGTAGATLISVSAFYRNVQVSGNILKGLSNLAGSTALQISLNWNKVFGNRIDGTNAPLATTICVLTPAGGPCDIFDNYVDGSGSSRCWTVGAGSNSGARIFFKGGSFIGAVEGINTTLNAPTNCPIWLQDLSENTCTSLLNLTGGADSMQTFFNTLSPNPVLFPHSIKGSRTMYGNAQPTQGTWTTGDRVLNLGPAAASVELWICTATGTPGTWKTVSNT